MRGDWLCGREESGMRGGLALWEGRERDEGGTGSVGGKSGMRGDWLCGREESGMREGLALWEGRERDEGGTGSVGGKKVG